MATVIYEEGFDGPKHPHTIHRTKQLLNNILDGTASTRPATLYGEFPISPFNYNLGVYKVTHGELANAVNGAAWWLTKELGPGKNFQTLCYMGWNDVRYIIFILGAVKAGYKLFFNSPGNSVEGARNLFKAFDCNILLAPNPQPPFIAPFLNSTDIRLCTVPSIEYFLHQQHDHFPYDKTFEKAKHEPLVALHTSGTTGMPKPVVYTHDYAASLAKMLQLPPPDGHESLVKLCQGSRVYSATLPFHSSGCFLMIDAITSQTAYIYPPPAVPPSAALIQGAAMHTVADGIISGPQLIAELANNPDVLESLSKKVRAIAYGGGDIAQHFGSVVSSKILLYTTMGSTETGPYPLIRRKGPWVAEDWKYIQPHPTAGLDFRHVADNLYEIYVVKNETEEDEQPVFKLFPHLTEYATRELCSPHPSKPDLWTYEGRTDDMINLSTTMMANPFCMEYDLAKDPDVRAVVMLPVQTIGLEKYAIRTCLLIEPVTKLVPGTENDLLEKIWPLIEDSNKNYRVETCIHKSHVIFVDMLPKTAKGSVARSIALSKFAREIGALEKV